MVNIQASNVNAPPPPSLSIDSYIKTSKNSTWDFFDIDKERENSHYFDDSATYIDPDFYNVRKQMRNANLILAVFSIFLLTSVIILFYLRITEDKTYKILNNIGTIYDKQEIKYAEGIEAETDVLIHASMLLEQYKQSIQEPKKIKGLKDICLYSELYQIYTNASQNVEAIYDENDGYVRVLNKFFEIFNYEIDRVIISKENPNVYYCYVKVTIPTELDIKNFIQKNTYIITKYFNNHDISTSEVVNCIDNQVLTDASFGASVSTIMVEMQMSQGNLIIVNDTPLYKMFNDAYNNVINNVFSIINNGTIVGNGN